MSFSKAKIQRFNDVQPCAPSPTAYTVVVSNKPKALGSEPKSPCRSDAGSTRSVPSRFRTPTLPKKKKTTTSVSKSKLLFGEQFDIEYLKEKIVECENKDASIKSLTDELEELKDKMCILNEQKKQLDLDKEKLEGYIVSLKAEHQKHIEDVSERFREDMNVTIEEKCKVSTEIGLLKKQYEDLKEANRQDMNRLKENCDKFNDLYKKSVEECNKSIEEKNALLATKEKELEILEKSCVELRKKHSMEIEKLKKEHQLEVQEIEFEILKTMTELQKEKEIASCKIKEIEAIMERTIADLKKKFEDEKEELCLRYEQKNKQIAEQMKFANKEALEQLEDAWKTKLETQHEQSQAILRECQTISEYNIIQCELEKKEIEAKLAEETKQLESKLTEYDRLVAVYDDLKAKHNELQCNFASTVNDLKSAKANLKHALTAATNDLKKCKEENRAYLITIKNSQNTIEVLKKRLIDSDRDVEQLKRELSENETKLLEYESKHSQLTTELKLARNACDELATQNAATVEANVDEIRRIESELLEKVSEYAKRVEKLSAKLSESEDLKNEAMKQLHAAQELIEKSKMEFDCFETINAQYEFEVEQSQKELEEYRAREAEWDAVRAKLERELREVSSLLELKCREADDFKRQAGQLREKCESYRCHSEYYRSKAAEYEEELGEAADIRRKYIEQSGRFDELLQKFEALEKENADKERSIEKFSRDRDEKENYLEMYKRQKDAYDDLLVRYEQLEKDNARNKKKLEDAASTKTLLEQIERQRDVLLDKVEFLEAELKETSSKLADLAGHNNNKQKIKHLVDLKTKNEELLQVNIDLDSKLKLQSKLVEKLKKENSDLKKKKSKLYVETEKENIASPNRSHNSSRVESPFRERN